MFAPKIILVPTDFSEHSDKAIRQAADIAEQNNAKIYLLHVVDKVQQCAVDYCIPVESVTKAQADGAENATQKMREEVQKLLQSRKIDVTFGVKVGVPYEEILQQELDRKADLIVIGSHGRTGVKRAFLGSVAEKVTREAKCPVLLVR
jgi:nucleotide-binding universal stress UspA family protein